GSIARVDALGRLLVGPRSAGAAPGPVCYGAGGAEPTVTDADLSLGRIDPARFSSAVTIEPAAAERAIQELIGDPLGLDLDSAAFAISEIVDENMASAARVHAIESGKSVEARTMIAFGGAAPLHAARVALKLGMRRVLVPAQAGVGSAVGFLAAAQAFEQAQSWFVSLDAFDPEPPNALMDQIARAARALLGEGVFTEKRRAYMRYRGQGHEIAVVLPDGALDAASAPALRDAFEARYAQLFGRAIPGVPVEALTWSVRVERQDLRHGLAASVVREPAAAGAAAMRIVFDPSASLRIPYEVHGRAALMPGERRAGPCLIAEAQTTTVCPRGFDLSVLADGSLLLEQRTEAVDRT
ncbi:MAG TPA: hydantoinase/oxoprolinase family protein, partial [Caulobacteraceae bacterium]|nr:hydantoinase/oxoprolinase family protein [Caulobacteraceae bacterium]